MTDNAINTESKVTINDQIMIRVSKVVDDHKHEGEGNRHAD